MKQKPKAFLLHGFVGSGKTTFAKRLEKGTFWWPESSHRGGVEMTSTQFAALIGGLDLQGMRRRRWYRVQPAQTGAQAS